MGFSESDVDIISKERTRSDIYPTARVGSNTGSVASLDLARQSDGWRELGRLCLGENFFETVLSR